MNRVKDKVALITGAARGIGEATAKLLAQEGAIVIVTDINDKDGIKVANEIGNNAIYFHLDVVNEEEWLSVINQVIKQFGHLDILVNNAGITGFEKDNAPHDPENTTLEQWRKVHAINAEGVFLGCKHAIQVMKKTSGGSIINISSRSGLVGIPGAAAYASSKASVRNHSKTVALYCAENNYNIRCNSIHPAAILTPMWNPMLGEGPDREEKIKKIAEDIPLKRVGEPNDVAYAVLYLASEESKYITGIELVIDGGILAGATASPKR